MKKKFKYLPFQIEYDADKCFQEFEKVNCPIESVRELPDGEYLIRNLFSIVEYWKIGNQWFTANIFLGDNHWYIKAKYRLFPILKHSEYELLRKSNVYNKLSDEWKANVNAYWRWFESREISRDVQKTCLQALKKYN